MASLMKLTVKTARKYSFKTHSHGEREQWHLSWALHIHLINLQTHPESDGVNFIYSWGKLKNLSEVRKAQTWTWICLLFRYTTLSCFLSLEYTILTPCSCFILPCFSAMQIPCSHLVASQTFLHTEENTYISPGQKDPQLVQRFLL